LHAFALLLLFAGVAQAENPVGKPAGSNALRGIDVSHHNAEVDWATVKRAGVTFAFMKATDGVSYVDPAFAERFKAAKAAGLIAGAYHFYETNDDGERQALWFIQNVPLAPGDLPPVVDIERIKKPLAGNVHAEFQKFLDVLEAHYGTCAIIYTGPTFWEHALNAHFPGRRLWVAEYGVEKPSVPPEWSAWSFWQYTDSLVLVGISNAVDGSFFNGDQTALTKLLLQGKPLSPER
jgi:lysozyme